MRASLKTDATLGDITRMVDQGVPAIVILDSDSPGNANLHYVTVSDYERGRNGEVSNLVIADSAGGGRRYTLPAAEFQQRWGSLRMGHVPTLLNSVMLSAVPNDGRMIVGGDRVARRASQVQLPSGSWPSAISSALPRSAGGIIGNTAKAIETGVEVVENAGTSLRDDDRQRREEIRSFFRPRWVTDPSRHGNGDDR